MSTMAEILAAARRGDARDVSELLRSDHARDRVPRAQAAWIAARHGDVAVLNVLIRAGCDLDWRAGDGSTPVYAAARHGHAAALDLLLKAGCDFDEANYDEMTPAQAAAKYGHSAALSVLIEAGCDVTKSARDAASEKLPRAYASFGDVSPTNFLVEADREVRTVRRPCLRSAKGPCLRSAVLRSRLVHQGLMR